MQTLETKLHDVELNGTIAGGAATSSEGGLEREFGQASIVNDLKVQITRLERENRSLRQSGGSEKETLLNSMLDDAQKSRDGLEQKYKEELEKGYHLADTVQKLEGKLQELETKATMASFKSSYAGTV